jgi:thiol:disulfide interchange protein DsbD
MRNATPPPLKLAAALALAALAVVPCPAQPRPSPARWVLTPQAERAAPGAAALFELRLELEPPWHMYSLSTPKPGPMGGPIATAIKVADHPAVSKFAVYQPPAKRKFDPNFQIETETYAGRQSFFLLVDIAPGAPAGETEIEAQMRFQLCTEKECMPPRRLSAAAKVVIDPAAPRAAPGIPAGYAAFAPGAGPADRTPAPEPAQGLSAFLLVAFGFGLASVFTPCVFPMIPITMSFFLHQQTATKTSAAAQAFVFCAGIVVLFTGIGLGLTAALGPFAVVQLGSNPWVNGLIAAVFFVFGLSLLGAFELTLPSGLLTRLNAASSRGGYLGTLIMGLTFCLASFACVGPFMGTLLAASVGGGQLQPVLGMAAFSTALAAPFFLLALFPGFLKRLPRSGGWMSRVKVVLGFLVLAAMVKYLSTVDQVLGWNLLSRERFLALWIVLFLLAGLYLLGWLRMEGTRADESLGVARLLIAALLLAFGVSLTPGLFGARLGEIEAYLPPAADGAAFNSPGGGAVSQWIKDDYAGAFAAARASGKPVLVAFTGYACTNCKWMKANMFTRPAVAAATTRMVLLELYTDGAGAVAEDNQRRQDRLFQTVAIPYYAIFDPEEKVLASFPGLTRDEAEFLAFLNQVSNPGPNPGSNQGSKQGL